MSGRSLVIVLDMSFEFLAFKLIYGGSVFFDADKIDSLISPTVRDIGGVKVISEKVKGHVNESTVRWNLLFFHAISDLLFNRL